MSSAARPTLKVTVLKRKGVGVKQGRSGEISPNSGKSVIDAKNVFCESDLEGLHPKGFVILKSEI